MNKFVFIDIETTGLNPDFDTILEVGCIATDKNLEITDILPSVVVQHTRQELEKMNEWCRTTHTANGLVQKVQTVINSLDFAEATVHQWLQRIGEPGVYPMCGNSVHFDRAFLARHMPAVERWFHYRNIDVSTVQMLASAWRPELWLSPSGRGTHRAFEDLQDSVKQLACMKKELFDVT
jgi:oligoribonuclease